MYTYILHIKLTCKMPCTSEIQLHSSSESKYFFNSLSAAAVLCRACIIKYIKFNFNKSNKENVNKFSNKECKPVLMLMHVQSSIQLNSTGLIHPG